MFLPSWVDATCVTCETHWKINWMMVQYLQSIQPLLRLLWLMHEVSCVSTFTEKFPLRVVCWVSSFTKKFSLQSHTMPHRFHASSTWQHTIGGHTTHYAGHYLLQTTQNSTNISAQVFQQCTIWKHQTITGISQAQHQLLGFDSKKKRMKDKLMGRWEMRAWDKEMLKIEIAYIHTQIHPTINQLHI